mgnify:FL=1
MRVLQIIDDLPTPPRGGVDLHVRELNRALREFDVESIILKLAVGEAARRAALDEPFDPANPGDAGRERPVVVEFGDVARTDGLVGQILDSPVIEAFEEALDRLAPDAVHIHSLQHLSHRLVDVARRRGIQVVWTMHDFFALCQRTHLRRGDGSSCDGPQGGIACGPCHGGLRGLLATPVFALRNAGFAVAMRTAHVIVAPSQFVKDILVEHGAPEHHVHVLPPAVPTAARPADLPSDPTRARIVYAGDLREAKGADLCVEALRQLERSDIALELHGGSPAPPAKPEAEFEAKLKTLAEGTNTSFHGRYDDADLMYVLDGATALVVPSRVRETFGRTANRALQLGVPVLAADHGALPEHVIDGVNGLLFAPGDASALAAAMSRIADEGVTMQSESHTWPEPPDLAGHVEALLPLYVWRP